MELILVSYIADLIFGDPRWLPHPVRGIGWLAQWLEGPTRRLLPARAAGIVTVILVLAIAGGLSYGLIRAAALLFRTGSSSSEGGLVGAARLCLERPGRTRPS